VVTLPHNHLVCVQTKSFLCIFLFVISSVLSYDELAFVSSFFIHFVIIFLSSLAISLSLCFLVNLYDNLRCLVGNCSCSQFL